MLLESEALLKQGEDVQALQAAVRKLPAPGVGMLAAREEGAVELVPVQGAEMHGGGLQLCDGGVWPVGWMMIVFDHDDDDDDDGGGGV